MGKKLHQFFQVLEIENISVFLQNLNIGGKNSYLKNISTTNLPTLLSLKEFKIFLIAYVYEKSFYFNCILGQTSYCPEEHFEEEKIYFVEKYNFLIAFGLWAEIFRTFREKFSKELSKLQSTSPEEHIKEQYFFEKFIIYFVIFGLSPKKFRLFEDFFFFFRQGCQTAFYGSRWIFW